MMHLLKSRKSLIVLAIVGGTTLATFVAYSAHTKPPKVEIITATLNNVAEGGRVAEGVDTAPKSTSLQTSSHLVFESKQIITDSKTVNSAVLKWDEQAPATNQTDTHSDRSVQVEFRTFNGKNWSNWVETTSSDEKKDGALVAHNALVLSDVIESIQYRFVLRGQPSKPSPLIDLEKASIELVDTSRGPKLEDVSKNSVKTRLSKLFQPRRVQAKADGPYIYNRAQWGSPEPYSSPSWEPEYAPLDKIIVHHTAATYPGDSFAAMRAIWHFHTYSNGWGDIGYNYVVDAQGNIMQGRFYDWGEDSGDVIGGHALGWNVGSAGISVIGDFSSVEPPDAMLYSVARIAALKGAQYDFNPADSAWFGPQLLAHRDVNETGCPGQRLYDRLGEIRSLVSVYYPLYNSLEHLDAAYSGQGAGGFETSKITLWPSTGGTAFIDLKNRGSETWGNSGFGAIMIGTDRSRDRKSQFCSGGWIGLNCDRPSSFSYKVTVNSDGSRTTVPATSIAPGEIARFEFQVKAPPYGGQYREHFHVLSAKRTWFQRDLGMYFDFTVPPPFYSWQWIEQGIYTDNTAATSANLSDLQAGERVYFQLKAKNTGNQPWYRGGANPARLATNHPQDKYSWLCDPTWVNPVHCNRAVALTEDRIDPGQVGTFGFWVIIPYGGTSDKLIREYFNLTIESKTWLNDIGQYWEFTVQSN